MIKINTVFDSSQGSEIYTFNFVCDDYEGEEFNM